MRQRPLILMIALVVGCGVLVGGCRKPKTVPTPPTRDTAPAEPTTPPEPTREITDTFPREPVDSEAVADPGIDELNRRGVLKTVYFDYDRYDLSPETRTILRSNADWLKANSARNIRVEGHCDERGTIEYNLALGERRANAVREYLASLGVPPDRVRIVTYGEERPADPGHGESAWSKNRRAEFVIEK